MGEQLLYRDLARYYDFIYHWKDYKKESAELLTLIQRYKKSGGKSLLEVGCGTGHHLSYLKKYFDCVGMDVNKDILSVARKKNKGVTFKQADMITMDFGKRFDVITSLFSGIGYVKTYHNLRKTIKNMAEHLVEGGVLLIEPWLTKEIFTGSKLHMHTYEDDDLKICRMSKSKRKGNLSILEMHYLIAEKGRKIRYFIDRHELGLFDTQKILEYMRDTGLKARFLKKGFMKDRGLFIGMKP